ncbi:MAG: ribonuclease P protein component 1 [Candidatus Nitrosotenuis sp.]|jgi:ribonuclease P protein subunit POP4
MITINSEFIGLQTQIADSTNKSLIGLEGTIAFETQKTFTLHTSLGTKIIPKQHNTWKFANDQVINGDTIAKRPEDRIKVKA